jgi:hypothetical protein
MEASGVSTIPDMILGQHGEAMSKCGAGQRLSAHDQLIAAYNPNPLELLRVEKPNVSAGNLRPFTVLDLVLASESSGTYEEGQVRNSGTARGMFMSNFLLSS